MTEHTEPELELELHENDPLYRVDGVSFDRTFTDDQIEEHCRTVLRICRRLKPPKALAPSVFQIVNAMVSDLRPRGTPATVPAQALEALNRSSRRRHGHR